MSYKHTVHEEIGGNPFGKKKTDTVDTPPTKSVAPAPAPRESDNAIFRRAIKKS